jgi:uncharacterized membrane protein YeaQ/YmgE (transglycosylase-associated protein family)
MILIVWIVLGGIIGWLGAKITGRREGIVASVIIGIVGAFIGSLIARALGSASTSYLTFTWAGLGWSLLGAVILSALLNMFSRRRTHDI